MKCKDCGAEQASNAKFCGKCGKRLDEQTGTKGIQPEGVELVAALPNGLQKTLLEIITPNEQVLFQIYSGIGEALVISDKRVLFIRPTKGATNNYQSFNLDDIYSHNCTCG